MFRTHQSEKGAGNDFTPHTKAEARTKKEKAKKALILNVVCQPLKHPARKDLAMPGIQTTGLPAIGLISP